MSFYWYAGAFGALVGMVLGFGLLLVWLLVHRRDPSPWRPR